MTTSGNAHATGPIVLVEDDMNDVEVILSAIKEIGIRNKCVLLHNADEAFDYLCTTTDSPFIILCDIRMPVTNGLALRRQINSHEELRRKSIPFVFYTGAVTQEFIREGYDMNVQGFYQKAKTYEGIREQLLCIFMYWKGCLHPNTKPIS